VRSIALERPQTFNAVASHSRQNDGDDRLGAGAGHRTKKNIDRRAASILGRLIVEGCDDPACVLANDQMPASGSKIRRIRLDSLAVGGFVCSIAGILCGLVTIVGLILSILGIISGVAIPGLFMAAAAPWLDWILPDRKKS
jgi:hypothetical protein